MINFLFVCTCGMCFLVSRLYPHPMCLQVKNAFRVRSKQPDPHAVPKEGADTTKDTAEHNKRKSEVSAQTPTKPSPNKQPSKKRAPKPKPTGDDADKQVKDLWAVQDWKCLIYQQDTCGLCNLTFFAGAAPSRSWSANS